MKLVIIGNGIAALATAESFRKYDTDSQVIMLSSDTYPSYYRIKLSHYLGKPNFMDEELFVKDADWYKERAIETHLGVQVESVDFDNKVVHMKGGAEHPYDKLLLSNGARPFVPPLKGADRKGVFTLRTMEDLKAIHKWIANKQNVVIIGGGLLGLEAAHGLVELGKTVNVMEFSDHLLSRQLDKELSCIVQKQLEAEGLSFSLGAGCEEILGSDTVSGVRLANGVEVPADAVLISAGVRPNTELFSGSSLTINKGVVVNQHMQTTDPDVYAAGDIAECHGMVYGLWTAANEQGKIAGANLAGQYAEYPAPQLSANLMIGSVKLFSVGDVANADRTVDFHESTVFHRVYIRDGIVVGVVLTGETTQMMKAKNLVFKRTQVPASVGDGDLFKELMG